MQNIPEVCCDIDNVDKSKIKKITLKNSTVDKL